ncbi:site-specific integrase [Caenispirillum salinarum]|nr:site-specific integrase [Caenispirillum salinarum]
MPLANCLKLKSQFYHGRVKVPLALVTVVGRKEILRTLRTRDPVKARRRARIFWLRCDGMFQALQQNPGLSRAQVQGVIDHFLGDALWLAEERLALGQPVFEMPSEPRPAEADDIDLMERRVRDGLARNDYSLVAARAQELARTYNIQGSGPDGLVLSRALMRATLTLTAEVRRRRQGDYRPEQIVEVTQVAANQNHTAVAPVPAPATATMPEPVAVDHDQHGRLEQKASDQQTQARDAEDDAETDPITERLESDTFALWEDYAQEMLATRMWTNHTRGQNDCSLRFFRQLHGDVGAADLKRRHIGAYQSMLRYLPALNGKSPRWKGMSGPEMAAAVRSAKEREADGEALPDDERIGKTLSEKTVRRHISALSGYWSWLADKGYVERDNPFLNFQKRGKKGRGKGDVRHERLDWEDSLLRSLLTSPAWTGHGRYLHLPGTQITRCEKFWVPLISVLSGMRIEEICHLRVGDVRQEQDVWVFDIKWASGHIKNDASKRLVPLHDELLRMGFIQDRVAGRDKSERLFKELSPRGKDEKYGIRISKWFTRYRQYLGIYEEKVDFHSLRHTVSTLLKNTELPEGWIDEVMGHESEKRRSEGHRYTKRIWLQNLQKTVNAINLGIDLSHLYKK